MTLVVQGHGRAGGLLPHVLVHGDSGNSSRKLPRRGKKDGVVRGVGQYRQHRLGQSEDAGRILESAGSTSDFKSHSTAGLQGREIYAIACLHESDLQQTSVLEAKHGRAGHTRKINLSWPRATAGLLRNSADRSYVTKGE